MRPTTTPLTAVAALLALAALTACSDGPVDAATAADTTPSPRRSSSPSVTAAPDYTLVQETHLDGPGRWALPAVGAAKAPLAVFTVPAGYQARSDYIWTHDEAGLEDFPGQVLYRSPTRVFSDPCDTAAPTQALGPSVQDLVHALTAQQRTTTTRPVAVTLGGHKGLYVELTSDAGVDFARCGSGDGMSLWDSGGGDTARVLEVAATDRYWILDVEGSRVVVTATTPSAATGASVKRVTDVAMSVTFVRP
ncbi:hypothetical protein N798_13860 [Knoellia flava TL1]|uniref:Lipoprotein n=2 Tax=Knoellia flava TaxID=913969 RepID=A0A8H9FST1_9MICO|nr:hypothetical protein [Knoellia flava]KGN29629.1 hypothetical protein N798_13860 [Knoellia flava TL1]GGB75048.1 hypothetical protein GCM10011314_13190 [Knoellia flava]